VQEELSRYDVTAEEIMVENKTYRKGRCSSETYLTAAGCVTVERHLYVGVNATDKTPCPLELRSGLISGYFTPRAARQGAFAMAQLTPGESEALLPRSVTCNRPEQSGSADKSALPALGDPSHHLGSPTSPG